MKTYIPLSMQRNGTNIEEFLIEQITLELKEIMKKILLYSQASMSESQFNAFRKLVMDAFGHELNGKMRSLLRKAMERAGAEKQIESRKEP